MVIVAQLVRALDCGSRGRGFETPHSPKIESILLFKMLFFMPINHVFKILTDLRPLVFPFVLSDVILFHDLIIGMIKQRIALQNLFNSHF